jgi:GntR family transcriptional regulator, rspAB operon transcriptional repressor
VLNELRRRIVLNELAPGTALTELALAADLSASQALIREALLRLEGEGLVTRAGYQGTTVTNLDAVEAKEILGLRRRIETRAANAVCRRISSGDVGKLHGLLEEMRVAARTEDLWAMVSADTEFHLTLFRASGLYAMEPILARCIMHTHRFRAWAPWHGRPLMRTADRHLPILEAAEAQDATALRRQLEIHLDTIVEQKSGHEHTTPRDGGDPARTGGSTTAQSRALADR